MAVPEWVKPYALAQDTVHDVQGEVIQIGSGGHETNPSYVWLRPRGGGVEHLARIDDLAPAES